MGIAPYELGRKISETHEPGAPLYGAPGFTCKDMQEYDRIRKNATGDVLYELRCFDALNAGTLCRAEDETEQAFMERVYRMLCEEEGAACGLIGLMKPSFLSCSAENRSLTLDFAAEDWMLNSKQTLHGGMLASMLDNTMGLAARFVCKTNRLSTVSLAVNYLRPVLSGERVTVAAQVDQAGRRMIFLSGCVYAENGKKAATATGAFMVL